MYIPGSILLVMLFIFIINQNRCCRNSNDDKIWTIIFWLGALILVGIILWHAFIYSLGVFYLLLTTKTGRMISGSIGGVMLALMVVCGLYAFIINSRDLICIDHSKMSDDELRTKKFIVSMMVSMAMFFGCTLTWMTFGKQLLDWANKMLLAGAVAGMVGMYYFGYKFDPDKKTDSHSNF